MSKRGKDYGRHSVEDFAYKPQRSFQPTHSPQYGQMGAVGTVGSVGNAEPAQHRSSPFQGQTPPPAAATREELARIFNTVLVSTRAESPQDPSSAICELMDSPAFHTILAAVRQHARLQSLPEKQAAEQIIRCFRQVDQLWHDYVFQQGMEKIKNVT